MISRQNSDGSLVVAAGWTGSVGSSGFFWGSIRGLIELFMSNFQIDIAAHSEETFSKKAVLDNASSIPNCQSLVQRRH